MIINHAGNYKAKRAAGYPPIEDQMDALWHAMDQGLLPKAEPFYSGIAAVKARFPKPPVEPNQ